MEYTNLRENATSILVRDKALEEFLEIGKNVNFEANLEGQGWKSTLFTIILILTCCLRYHQKTMGQQKKNALK